MSFQKMFDARMDSALDAMEGGVRRVQEDTAARVLAGELTDEQAREAVAAEARKAIARLVASFDKR